MGDTDERSRCDESRREAVRRLNRRIDEALGAVLPRGRPCALLDFPNYANVGDSALWLGEREWLAGAGVSVAYACDIATYSPRALAARVPEGPILLSGGGNLGDLWPPLQRFRERVIQDFPDRPIVQLPQSIHFRDKANLNRARAVFDGHPALTILVRDDRSLQFARSEFRATSLLCPDMAFALGMLHRPVPPDREVVWLSRTDIEASWPTFFVHDPQVEQADWLEDEPSPILAVNRFLSRRLWRRVPAVESRFHPVSRTYDLLARQRLQRGCRMLSRGHIVITDRLHGHILSLLMGIPHVVLDNNNGKLSSFRETWTKRCELTVWADAPEEALRQAHLMARSFDLSATR